jgi:cyclin-dependent kinase regulatory subunit CKS1
MSKLFDPAPEPHVLLFRRAKDYAPPKQPVMRKDAARRK